MSNPSSYVSKSLDHLDLVAALCKEVGIADFIDKLILTQSELRHISYGELLVA